MCADCPTFQMAPIGDRRYNFEYEINTDDECKFRPDSVIEPDCGTNYRAIDNGIESGTNTSDNINSGSSSSSSNDDGSIGNNNVVKKIEDPLSEPIVRSSLQKIQISSSQLINMSVKDLNKLLSSFPAYVISKLKRCRRTLKNRGYAKNCRIKRVAAKTELEHINMKLMIEIRELRQRNRSLLEQLNQLNANNQTVAAMVALRSGIGSMTPASDLHHQPQQQQQQQQRHQASHTSEANTTNTNNSQQITNYDTPNHYNEYSHHSQEHYTNLAYTCSSDGNYLQLTEPDLDYIVESINSTDNPTFAYDWQPTVTRQPSLY